MNTNVHSYLINNTGRYKWALGSLYSYYSGQMRYAQTCSYCVATTVVRCNMRKLAIIVDVAFVLLFSFISRSTSTLFCPLIYNSNMETEELQRKREGLRTLIKQMGGPNIKYKCTKPDG